MADGHNGNNPAAWTAVTVAMVAFCVGAAGLMLWSWPVFWIGIALLVVAFPVGMVMSAMGLGER